jgi:uncharacterized protein YuzE
MPLDGYYDRDADMVWITLPGFDGERAVGYEESWGLREVDERTGQIVALELWQASTQLPPALLEALPTPKSPQPA